MKEEKTEKKGNPFVEGLFKNVGRDVTVIISTSDGVKKIVGRCEAVELQQKCVIIRDDEKTYFIKNFLWMERERSHKQREK